MMRRLLTISLSILLLLPSLSITGFGDDKDVFDIPVIKAKSHYELGYKQGCMFRSYYKKLFLLCRIIFGRNFNNLDVGSHIETLKSRYPEFLERLKGLSESLNLNTYDVVRYSLALSSIKSGCTISSVTRNVTKDGKRYLSWNLDLHYLYKILFSRYLRPPPIVICDIEGRYRYVEINSIPSIFGFGLLNEKGLACVYAMVVSNDFGEGLTPLELNHLAMERCKNVDEVREIYENNERESGWISVYTAFGLTATLTSIWSDSSGKQMLVEYNHSKVIFVYDDILAATNHYQYLCKGRKIDQYMSSSRLRLERAYKLLKENAGRIDEEFYMKVFTKDHENFLKIGDSFDICRHGLTYGTVCSIIIKPDDYVAFYSPGHPCKIRFRTIDLRELVEDF